MKSPGEEYQEHLAAVRNREIEQRRIERQKQTYRETVDAELDRIETKKAYTQALQAETKTRNEAAYQQRINAILVPLIETKKRDYLIAHPDVTSEFFDMNILPIYKDVIVEEVLESERAAYRASYSKKNSFNL